MSHTVMSLSVIPVMQPAGQHPHLDHSPVQVYTCYIDLPLSLQLTEYYHNSVSDELASTYHKCVIFKLVSEIKVGHKVSALLPGVSPGHGCTYRTHLQHKRERGRERRMRGGDVRSKS